MGGTTAYLSGLSVASGQAARRLAVGAGLVARLRSAGTGPCLKAAVILNLAALVAAVSASERPHHALFIAASLLLVGLALWLSKVDTMSSIETDAPRDATMVEPAAAAVTPHPAALPFMGERILLSTDHSSISKLSKAAARLGQISPARAHPWGELMARVSHELRTPLNAVIGFSDVIDAELLGPVGHPRYREYARHIRDCGRELLKSAEDTLAITSLLEGDHEGSRGQHVDLMRMVDEAWGFYESHVEARGIGLQDNVPEGLELLVEHRALRQILINLFAEALRRVEDGGSIGLTAFAHGDLVQLEVLVRGRPDSASVGQASLAICLARALLELQGAALVEVDDPNATWRALTVLKCAAQDDFFRLPRALAEQTAHHVN